MPPQKPKRRHHINPRFYLRAFQAPDAEGYIWRYDTGSGEILKLSIDDASVRRDYYSHVNEDGLRDTEFIENFISDIESEVAPVFEKIITSSDPTDNLTDQERLNFSYFVSLSWLRSPANRRQTAEFLGALIKSTSYAVGSDAKSYLQSYRRMEADKDTKEEEQLSDEEIEETRVFMLSDEYDVNISEQVTLLPLVHLQEVAETIVRMNWTWLASPDGIDFITSDSPVIRSIPPVPHHPMMGLGLRNKFIEVSLPVSPKLCWLGTWIKSAPEIGVAEKQHVKSLNRLRAIDAENYLYASTFQTALGKLGKKYRRAGTKLAPSGLGFTGDPIDIGQYKDQSLGVLPPQSARDDKTI